MSQTINTTTLVAYYFPTKADLERALARKDSGYTVALYWDMAEPASPASEGWITQFRTMLLQTGRLPYTGFAAACFVSGSAPSILDKRGVDFDSLTSAQQDEAIEHMRAQRRRWSALVHDPRSTIRHFGV